MLDSTFPNIYNSGMEIMQAPGLVVIRYEMIHETRIIPLDGRPHVGPAIRSYMGDPRGRWDGSTLVVETTNFNGRTGSYARNGNGNPTSDALRLVERFTLGERDTLQYSAFRRRSADVVTQPWSVAFSLTRDDEYPMLRIRLPRGQLRDGEYAQRCARALATRGLSASTSSSDERTFPRLQAP